MGKYKFFDSESVVFKIKLFNISWFYLIYKDKLSLILLHDYNIISFMALRIDIYFLIQ